MYLFCVVEYYTSNKIIRQADSIYPITVCPKIMFFEHILFRDYQPQTYENDRLSYFLSQSWQK